MSKLKDLTGQKFSRLTVVARAKNNIRGRAMWECICDCGGTKTILGVTLRNGRSKSCGCIRSELNTERLTTHGGAGSREYSVWVGMKQRCYNPSNKEFSNYGARGISVCKAWHSFKSFIEDMGCRPGSEYSIERIDNDKGYSPDNCKWATMSEQTVNRRNTVFIDVGDARIPMVEWVRDQTTDINPGTIYSRINSGWEPKRAISEPVKHF